MRKRMISKKGAKEETNKTITLARRGQKRQVLNLKMIFFWFFPAPKSPREAPRGWGSADGGGDRSPRKNRISEKRCARASSAAHFSKVGRETSGSAHKFACELGALLASDKHLGSAERSERQVLKPKHASECPRHCGGFMGCRRCRRPIVG